MEFQIADILRTNVNRQVDKLVGDKDTNLSSVIKMSLLNDYNSDYNIYLDQMKNNNVVEKIFIDNEYQLTYDGSGNLILASSIYGEPQENQADTRSILLESERSK